MLIGVYFTTLQIIMLVFSEKLSSK